MSKSRKYQSALHNTPLRSGKSEYICSTPFSNDMPPLPFDPKLLKYEFDPDRFTVSRRTTLDAAYKHELYSDTVLVPIDLVDPSVYRRGREEGISLAPEDAALIGLCEQALSSDVGSQSTKPRPQRRALDQRPIYGKDTFVPWLKQPEYMDPAFREGKAGGGESEFDVARRKSAVTAKPRTSDEITAEIEASFMHGEITHPAHKGETPVKISKVLPDIGRIGSKLLHVSSDARLNRGDSNAFLLHRGDGNHIFINPRRKRRFTDEGDEYEITKAFTQDDMGSDAGGWYFTMVPSEDTAFYAPLDRRMLLKRQNRNPYASDEPDICLLTMRDYNDDEIESKQRLLKTKLGVE